MACARGSLDVVRKEYAALVPASAGPNERTHMVNKHQGWNCMTPLMAAAQAGCSVIVRFLLDNGANATLVNHLGSNALLLAAEEVRMDNQ